MEGAGDVTDSEMLAELYIAQGHPEKGLEVYRRLAAKEPHNLRLHEKIQRLAEGGAGSGTRRRTDTQRIRTRPSSRNSSRLRPRPWHKPPLRRMPPVRKP